LIQYPTWRGAENTTGGQKALFQAPAGQASSPLELPDGTRIALTLLLDFMKSYGIQINIFGK
jgi:hypothetical protein